MKALSLVAFNEGTQPVAGKVEIGRASDAPLGAVADGAVQRSLTEKLQSSAVIAGAGWTAYLVRESTNTGAGASVSGWITAVDTDTLDDISRQITKLLAAEPASDGLLPIKVWTSVAMFSPRSSEQLIQAPRWDDVARNYPPKVRGALDQLMRSDPASLSDGRIIVLHGEPGTGKSTAIRSLSRAWHPWCAVEVLTDPKSILGDARSVDDLVLTPPTIRDDDRPAWKLLVIEDAHDLVAAGSSGSDSLVRLLNLTDGVLGSATKTLFLITTNARVPTLHPAILRPGRCLAEIEFTAHTSAEAQAWLGPESTPRNGPQTLAELYATKHARPTIRHASAPVAHGTYL